MLSSRIRATCCTSSRRAARHAGWLNMTNSNIISSVVKDEKSLEKQIEDLNRQKGLIEPRLEFTSELQDVAQAKGDVFEIMEEYDEEAETAWKEQHRENVKRFHEKEREERLARQSAEEAPSIKNKCSGDSASDMEAIWKRLDELEAEENEEEEKCQSLNNIIKINGGGDCQPASAGTKQSCSRERPASSESSKSVKWLDLEKVSKDDAKNDDGSEAEDSDESSDDVDKELTCRTKTIYFVHSPVEPNISSSDVTEIVSPADIYRHILHQPKSILKTASIDQESISRTVNTRQESKQSPEEDASDINLRQENDELMKRLGDLQQKMWTLEEKVSHLESSNAAMADDLLNKSSVIEHYSMDSRAGQPVTSPSQDKITLKRVVDFVIDKGDENMKDINRKLQRVLEETLTKNMHLQQDLETVSTELSKLQKQHSSLSSGSSSAI